MKRLRVCLMYLMICFLLVPIIGCKDEEEEECDGPLLRFARVPPKGSYSNLTGEVGTIDPGDYKVAVYIHTWNGWWTKPYWNSPLTYIDDDCSWECDITTGGIDETADKIAAFLVPNGTYAPRAGGDDDLPDIPSAIAKIEANR